MPLLEVRDLHASYGKAVVLQGVDLALEGGELVAVVGPNGAGKTTLMRAISGLAPWTGEIRFDGERIDHLPAHVVVRKRIVLCPERRRLFPAMTVDRNLEMGAYLRRDRRACARDLDKVFALFPQLAERRRQLAGTLSGGEQQMLAVARALMSDPKLLMLDEPSFGLAPRVKDHITETLRTIRRSGITILLAEQDARMAFAAADRALVLENGRIAVEGDRDSVLANTHVREVYLGLG